MKAVIFSCSIKDAKNSDTQTWCELLSKLMTQQSIESEIINLKQFDHEASTGPDMLHLEMGKIYDADFVVIASPVNFRESTFFARNLASRFQHAYEKSKTLDINLYENKIFEICIMQGCLTDDLKDGTEIKDIYHGRPTWIMKSLLPPVKYVKQLDPPLHVSFDCVTDRRGPTRQNLHQDQKSLDDINSTIESFKKAYVQNTPKFSKEIWMKCFESDDPNAFGRGYTLSKENLTEENVINHRKWVNQNIEDQHHRAQIWVAMKERCIKNDFFDGAEMYFDEQFKMARKGQVTQGEIADGEYRIMKWKGNSFRGTRTANYRPNNY